MGGGDLRPLRTFPAKLLEKSVPFLPAALFKAEPPFFRKGANIPLPHLQGDPPFLAEAPDKGFIPVAFLPPETMVQMSPQHRRPRLP